MSIEGIIVLFTGAIIGVLTSWFFERRSLQAANEKTIEQEKRNEDLEKELSLLQSQSEEQLQHIANLELQLEESAVQVKKVNDNVIFSRIDRSLQKNPEFDCANLAQEVYRFAQKTLGPDGTVAISKIKGSLVKHTSSRSID